MSERSPFAGRKPTDAELVERARDGDVSAYEELVVRFRDIAFRVAWLITRDRHEAEDATQEAFVKAYYALTRFRSDAAFKPWLVRIVANEAKNRGRSLRRRESLALNASGEPAISVPSPEAETLAREESEELLAAVNRLREGDRLVVAYRYFLDMSEAEMASALDVRPGTVKSRLARATARLRSDLEGEAR